MTPRGDDPRISPGPLFRRPPTPTPHNTVPPLHPHTAQHCSTSPHIPCCSTSPHSPSNLLHFATSMTFPADMVGIICYRWRTLIVRTTESRLTSEYPAIERAHAWACPARRPSEVTMYAGQLVGLASILAAALLSGCVTSPMPKPPTSPMPKPTTHTPPAVAVAAVAPPTTHTPPAVAVAAVAPPKAQHPPASLISHHRSPETLPPPATGDTVTPPPLHDPTPRGMILYFATDSAEAYPPVGVLDGVKKWPAIRIAGHCDERGPRAYNMHLGARRADAVRRLLITLGIPAQRIQVTSFGATMPVALEHNEEAWAKNRRVEITR